MAQRVLELLAVFLVCVCVGEEQNSIESGCSPGQSPPYIKRPDSQDRNLLKEGKGAVFQCEADGSPAPTYQWFRNDVAIDDKGDYLKAFTNGTLVFKDFSYRDGGMFQCRAKNSFGTSVSVKVPILANIDLGNKKENKEDSVTVSQGQPFHLYCAHAPENSQGVRKYWYVDVKKYQVSSSSRVGIDTNVLY
ncbi:contactin-5-like [Physella acuta]|uniref:contactin-5-like n=1 Tax=Physella acuta TaxID=109671 RepID=UPI0027DD5E6A|nr:contactin-5-like [Physella acuta]